MGLGVLRGSSMPCVSQSGRPGSSGIIRDGALADFLARLSECRWKQCADAYPVKSRKRRGGTESNRQTLRIDSEGVSRGSVASRRRISTGSTSTERGKRPRKRPGRTEPGVPLKTGISYELPGSAALRGCAERVLRAHPDRCFSVRVRPASFVVPVGRSKNLRPFPGTAAALVEEDLSFTWEVVEGAGRWPTPTAKSSPTPRPANLAWRRSV